MLIFKIKCYSVMHVSLEWGTLSITSIIHIQLLFLSSNYSYFYFLTNSSFFLLWKFWLILLLELRKGCWKVSSSFLYFLAGPDPAVIVWFNRISMHWCLQKLACYGIATGTVTLCFPFPGILLNNSKELSINTDWY